MPTKTTTAKQPSPPPKKARVMTVGMIRDQVVIVPQQIFVKHYRVTELVVVIAAAGIALYVMASFYLVKPESTAAALSAPHKMGLTESSLNQFQQWLTDRSHAAQQSVDVPSGVVFK